MSDPRDSRQTILAVDDMPENLALLADILSQEYRLQVARNGQRALELAQTDPQPDLILLDLMMPGMDGYAVCEALKATPRTSRIPVIFLTAKNEVSDELRGFDLGAVDYLSKPVSPHLLRARVRSHLTLANLTRNLQTRISERTRALEEQIRERDIALARADYLALNDPQTGLPNRRHLRQQLDQMLSAPTQGHVAILHFNLDRLGLINHSAGPTKADAVLAQAAFRLKAACGSEDFVARSDSDNFIMLLKLNDSDISSARQKVSSLANSLRKTLAQPVQKMIATTCVGSALLPDDCADADTGLACALAALRRAKMLGPNNSVAYTPELGQAARDEHRLERLLQSALQQEALEVHFQPQVALQQQRICGAECLIRWPDGKGGYISNGSFLPVAENTGLIHGLDDEVIRQALNWLATQKRLAPDFRLSINISAASLGRPGWLENLPSLISDHGIPPERVELEITEQNLIRNLAETSQRLKAISDTGLYIAADDFGSGYSSLAWLEKLPVDRIKLDRQFITNVSTSPRAAAIARAMIHLTAELGMDCVIEGIENQAQLDFALQEKAPHGQGFFLHRPMPPAHFQKLLQSSYHRELSLS